MKIVLVGTQSPRIERAAVYTMIGLAGYFIGRLVEGRPMDLLIVIGYLVGAVSALGLIWAHMSAMKIKLVRVDNKGVAQVVALGDEDEETF